MLIVDRSTSPNQERNVGIASDRLPAPGGTEPSGRGITQSDAVHRATGADKISDPWEGLVEKTVSDPSAPFDPAVLERIAAQTGKLGCV